LKIIIIESEVYLAQSIANKLVEHHFETEIFRSVKDAMDSKGDAYLLSTGLQGQAIAPLIEKYKDKIIILMVNYINNDTVGEPMRLGAKDYILKPFRIEELFRKIEHYREYKELKRENEFYNEYISQMNKSIDISDAGVLELPTVLISNSILGAERLIFEYAIRHRYSIVFISLSESSWKDKLLKHNDNKIYCITDFKSLKKSEKDAFWNSVEGLKFVLISETEIESSYNTILLSSKNQPQKNNSGIMTVDEYVKSAIEQYQFQYPDTELSKMLGMSRKSLWEKRKKYDISKKK
jgi:DNA-binding NtrC family response regulator